jgi:Flp pilus assembly protein TadG
MMKTMRADSGAVAVMFVLMVVMLVVIAAFAVDAGYWYTSRWQLQSAADAAALAGCQDLATGKSDAEIWATVEDYADRNFGVPLDLATCNVEPESTGGLSEIGDRFVKVTVYSNAPAFLSRVIGLTSTRVAAQAVARIGYLSGARNPVPWGLPLLQTDRIEVSAGGGPEQPLSDADDDGIWTGEVAAGSLGSVLVRAYNDQTVDPNYPDGVPEDAPGAGYVIHIPTSSPITAISMARLAGGTEHPGSMVFTSGAGERVVVYASVAAPLVANESLNVVFGGNIAMTKLSDTLYRAEFAAPSTDDLHASHTFGIKLDRPGNQNDYELTPAGGFMVRRSTFPILDVTVEPSAYNTGTPGPAQVSVQLNDYKYGQPYEMKVTGGAGEVGNFMALDFHTLHHPPNWEPMSQNLEYPDMPSGTSASYYPYIAGTATYPFVMHIGDAVWTQTGNLSGPTTRDALETRFAGEPANFALWALTKPPSRRLVLVPIVEKIQETTGSTPLRIISFGSFYVEDVDAHGGDVSVTGRFVEYVAPGMDVEDDPPGPIVVEAVHLTSRDLDF